jgi:hypothetical protein
LPNPGSRTFTYIRRRPSLTGLNYTVWTSKNLSEWTEDTTATQTATDIPSTDNQSVEVFLNPALLSSNRLFLRVQAQ